MDTLPLILHLIKTNHLLYAFLLTGNVESAANDFSGKITYMGDACTSVILRDFNLDSEHSFEYIQITNQGDHLSIMLVANDATYFNQKELFFGEKTIYYNLLDQIKEKGIVLSSPYRYCYPFMSQKAGISILNPKLFSITYGDNICKNF